MAQPPTASDAIDWNKAMQLYQKQQAGQPLTPDDQAYLDKAKKERAAGGGPGGSGQTPQTTNPSTLSSPTPSASTPNSSNVATSQGQAQPSAVSETIDWNKAMQLYQKQQGGQPLTPDEQAYLDNAKKVRAAGGGPGGSGQVTQSTNAPTANSPTPNASTQNSSKPAASSVAPPTTLPSGIVEQQDIVIGKGGDRDLHADIAYPQNATGPLPAIIWIHGGGWVSGTYKPSPVVEMAKHGYFAASIEYRTSNVAHWPAQIQDCKLAVRWLRANAAQYHVDPNHIGAWGGSAGGHLANCLGTMTDPSLEGSGGYPGVSSAVQCVVDSFGPTDFTDPSSLNGTSTSLMLVEKLVGAPYSQNPDLWKSASPAAFAKAGNPPFLIIHGDSDQTVPVAQAIAFDAALTKAGVPHQLIIIKNCGHDFSSTPGAILTPPLSEVTKATYDFLAKNLKGPS